VPLLVVIVNKLRGQVHSQLWAVITAKRKYGSDLYRQVRASWHAAVAHIGLIGISAGWLIPARQ